MKIEKSQPDGRLIIMVVIIILVGIFLAFGTYRIGLVVLADKISQKRQQQAMDQLNQEKIKEARERSIQVAVVSGKISKIDGQNILVSSKVYGNQQKIVKMKLKDGAEIYKYQKKLAGKDSQSATAGQKVILSLNDLKVGTNITSEPDEPVSLYQINKTIIEISSILVNDEIENEGR